MNTLPLFTIKKPFILNYVTVLYCLAELPLDDADSDEEDQAEVEEDQTGAEEDQAQPRVPMARETSFVVLSKGLLKNIVARQQRDNVFLSCQAQ